VLDVSGSTLASEIGSASPAESRARRMFGTLERLLGGVRTARIRFDLSGSEASLRVAIDAPELFQAPATTTR
jgi:hypothetical protein